MVTSWASAQASGWACCSEEDRFFEKNVASGRSELILANRFLSYGKDLLD
jgi:hypothetical protein